VLYLLTTVILKPIPHKINRGEFMGSIQSLQQKEVINIYDASRLGCVSDIVVSCNGCIDQLVVVSNSGFWNFFSKSQGYNIAWSDVVKIGDDIVLVNVNSDNLVLEDL
jgi:YlmC/YmxH family sporulation protein